MNIATTRNLTNSALAYLSARPGEQFQASQIADFYGCHVTTMRGVLIRLNVRGELRSKTVKRTVFYWFEPKSATAAPRPSPITHKTYALPAVLAERGREIQSDRAAFPSRHI